MSAYLHTCQERPATIQQVKKQTKNRTSPRWQVSWHDPFRARSTGQLRRGRWSIFENDWFRYISSVRVRVLLFYQKHFLFLATGRFPLFDILKDNYSCAMLWELWKCLNVCGTNSRLVASSRKDRDVGRDQGSADWKIWRRWGTRWPLWLYAAEDILTRLYCLAHVGITVILILCPF